MNERPDSYNLLVQPWIPVLWSDGTYSRVGIKDAFTQACRIWQIAASNPMDNVALLRFLLAVLQWCKPSLSKEDRRTLEGAEGIPAEWFEEKLGTADAPSPTFELLGDSARFYQDKSTPANNRPIGDLVQEFPTETKIAHFRHVRDGRYGMCPSCCAMGIVRFSTFANAYGHGRYTSAVNGPTPAYAIPQGATLLETFVLSWPEQPCLRREPPWLCDQNPAEADLDAVSVFAWRSRRLWLGDCGSSEEPCAYCGQPARLIRRFAFTGNWQPPFHARGRQKKFWEQDPHLILEQVSERRGGVGEDTDGESEAIAGRRTVTTLGFPGPASRTAAHVRFWRRAHAAILSRSDPGHRGTVARTITVAGPAANKGLYQDATALSLSAVPAECSSAAVEALEILSDAVERLPNVLRRSTRNPGRQHPNRRAALDAQSASLEARLRQEFDGWLRDRSPSTEGSPSAAAFWLARLMEQLPGIVEAAVAASTPGSALRWQEAAERARQALDEAMAEIGARRSAAARTAAQGGKA